MKTFREFILESDSKRKAWDSLPGETITRKNEVTPLQRIQSGINQLIRPKKSYIRQDLEKRYRKPAPMPGAPSNPVDDPSNVKKDKNYKMPIEQGRYTKPKYYDV